MPTLLQNSPLSIYSSFPAQIEAARRDVKNGHWQTSAALYSWSDYLGWKRMRSLRNVSKTYTPCLHLLSNTELVKRTQLRERSCCFSTTVSTKSETFSFQVPHMSLTWINFLETVVLSGLPFWSGSRWNKSYIQGRPLSTESARRITLGDNDNMTCILQDVRKKTPHRRIHGIWGICILFQNKHQPPMATPLTKLSDHSENMQGWLMGFVVEKSPLACTGMPMGSGVCSLWVLAAVGVLVDLRSKKQIRYTVYSNTSSPFSCRSGPFVLEGFPGTVWGARRSPLDWMKICRYSPRIHDHGTTLLIAKPMRDFGKKSSLETKKGCAAQHLGWRSGGVLECFGGTLAECQGVCLCAWVGCVEMCRSMVQQPYAWIYCKPTARSPELGWTDTAIWTSSAVLKCLVTSHPTFHSISTGVFGSISILRTHILLSYLSCPSQGWCEFWITEVGCTHWQTEAATGNNGSIGTRKLWFVRQAESTSDRAAQSAASSRAPRTSDICAWHSS